MPRLNLGVYESPGGRQLANFSRRAQGTHFRTDRHGFAELTTHIPAPAWESFAWYSRESSTRPHVELGTGAFTAYEGRLEDLPKVDGGFDFSAFGYRRAFADRLYTALWSDDTLDRWRDLTEDDQSTSRPDRFKFDKRNRLYIAPEKNSVHGTTGSNKSGIWGYEPPDGGSRQIVAVSFDWEFKGLTNWTATWSTRDSSWAQIAGTTIANGNAGATVQTGSVNATFAGCDRLTILMRYNAADITLGVETGDYYLKIRNLRVKTVTVATLSSDLVLPDLLALAPALRTSTHLVQSPGVDLTNEIYLDMRPEKILDYYCQLGDSASSTRVWEWGVWEDRYLHFRPRGSASNTWCVDVNQEQLELDQSIADVWNRAYSVRQDAEGRENRGSASTDTASVNRIGLTREEAVRSNSTNATQANRERDLYLNDHKNSSARGSLPIYVLYSLSGARCSKYRLRAGDTVIMRNVSPTASTTVDRLRAFRVDATDYDVDQDVVHAEPEGPPNGLERYLTRVEAKLNVRGRR